MLCCVVQTGALIRTISSGSDSSMASTISSSENGATVNVSQVFIRLVNRIVGTMIRDSKSYQTRINFINLCFVLLAGCDSNLCLNNFVQCPTGPASSSFRRVSIPLPENIYVPGSNLLKSRLQGKHLSLNQTRPHQPLQNTNLQNNSVPEKITGWYSWPFGLPTQRFEEISLNSILPVLIHPKNQTFHPTFKQFFMPVLSELASDPVKNVRSSVARVIGALFHVESFKDDSRFMDVWGKLSLDGDRTTREVLKRMSGLKLE